MKKNLLKSLTTLMIATVALSSALIIPKRDVEAATKNDLINRVCTIARNQVGYKGYGSTGNKYGKWIYDNYGDLYWGSKEYVAWCDVFVDWCLIQALDYNNFCKLTNQGKGKNGSSNNKGGAKTYYKDDRSNRECSEGYYEKIGRLFYPSNTSIQKGDQIFFTYEHTGLVVDVQGSGNNKTYYVVEGNVKDSNGNKVVRLTPYYNTSKFRSIGRPDYASIATTTYRTINSPEEELVTRLYDVCCDRNPDQSGFNYWVNQLKNKTPASTVVWEFFNSAEFKGKKYDRNATVKRLYRAILNREFDYDGYMYWEGKYYSTSFIDMVRGFVNSDEFKNYCNNKKLAFRKL